MKRHDESGQVSVLIIGFTAMLLLAVALVANASAAFLHRQALNSVADGAALHAADAGVGASLTLGDEDRLTLDPVTASVAVEEYLRGIGAPARFRALTQQVEVTDEGAVLVRLQASLEMPLPMPGTPRRTLIIADASAAVTVLR